MRREKGNKWLGLIGYYILVALSPKPYKLIVSTKILVTTVMLLRL